MMVSFEGSLVKVKLQVILNAAIADRNYQVLLGTDNLLHLGARWTRRRGTRSTPACAGCDADLAVDAFGAGVSD
jgi:hypothetical protein